MMMPLLSPSITRAVVLCDGRCKLAFEGSGSSSSSVVVVLSRDARHFVVVVRAAPAVPSPAAAVAAAAASPAAPELHATALALRHHRPLLVQALAVRNAHPPPPWGSGPWRPYVPRWLGGGSDDDGGDGDDGGDPASLAAKAELAAACFGAASPSWWLEPCAADLPPAAAGSTPGPTPLAAAVVWTPRETLACALLPPPPPPPPPPPAPPPSAPPPHPCVEAEARGVCSGPMDEDLCSGGKSSRGPRFVLRTRMGGRFFEAEEEEEAPAGPTGPAASPSSSSLPPGRPQPRRLYARAALPERLKGVAVRLIQLRSAAARALLTPSSAAAAAALLAPPADAPPPARCCPPPVATTTAVTATAVFPGLGHFAADGPLGLVRAALADGTLVHLYGREARVTLADGRLVVVPRRMGGGPEGAAAAAAAAAAAFFGQSSSSSSSSSSSTTTPPPPPPQQQQQPTTPALIAAAIALAEDFGAWALGGERERARRRAGAAARARADAWARAAARTADALGDEGPAAFLPSEEGGLGALGSERLGEAVQRTLRLNSDALARLDDDEERG